jgi:hypothetical protein
VVVARLASGRSPSDHRVAVTSSLYPLDANAHATNPHVDFTASSVMHFATGQGDHPSNLTEQPQHEAASAALCLEFPVRETVAIRDQERVGEGPALRDPILNVF